VALELGDLDLEAAELLLQEGDLLPLRLQHRLVGYPALHCTALHCTALNSPVLLQLLPELALLLGQLQLSLLQVEDFLPKVMVTV
jgi:hypothetical protein